MIRVGLLLLLGVAIGLFCLRSMVSAQDAKKAEPPVIAIHRGGGRVDPARNPFAYYWFTVAKDGAWELKPLMGETRKGKLGADDVAKWRKDIEDGGFDKLKSNPNLGEADETFMDITLLVNDKTIKKRIPLQAKLAQALEKKVAELTKLGK